jgi:hypothetical protein
MAFWKKFFKSKYTGAEIEAAVGKAGNLPATTSADAGKALVVDAEGKIVAGEAGGIISGYDEYSNETVTVTDSPAVLGSYTDLYGIFNMCKITVNGHILEYSEEDDMFFYENYLVTPENGEILFIPDDGQGGIVAGDYSVKIESPVFNNDFINGANYVANKVVIAKIADGASSIDLNTLMTLYQEGYSIFADNGDGLMPFVNSGSETYNWGFYNFNLNASANKIIFSFFYFTNDTEVSIITLPISTTFS